MFGLGIFEFLMILFILGFMGVGVVGAIIFVALMQRKNQRPPS